MRSPRACERAAGAADTADKYSEQTAGELALAAETLGF